MPLSGEYEPSRNDRDRKQVELYEATNGIEGGTLNGKPVIILTFKGAKSGKIRKTPLMRMERSSKRCGRAKSSARKRTNGGSAQTPPGRISPPTEPAQAVKSRCSSWSRYGETTMAKKLEGKIAVITGGTEGIGLATAKLFVKEGAYVFITGRRQKELDAAVKAIGSDVSGVQGDVAKLADLDRLYETVAKAKGQLDIVFANAGVGEFVPIGAVTEDFDKLFNVNVR